MLKMNNKFRPPGTLRQDTELTLILVDYSNLLYRAWFVSREQPWVAFCKFFDMLRLCIHKAKQPGVPIGVIFAGESHTKLERTKLFPDYKGGRTKPKNPEFAEYRKVLNRLISKLGWNILSVDGAEADDVIASIVEQDCHRCYCKVKCENCDCALKYKTDIVIFSGDKDLLQLLAWDRTLIYKAPGLFVGKSDFEEEYGIPVTKYGVYKALIGDSSDNISGVNGFGPVKAKMAINQHTVAEDIWELGGSKAADDFKKALQLVSLNTKLNINLEGLYIGEPLIFENDMKNVDYRIVNDIKRLREEWSHSDIDIPTTVDLKGDII